MVDVGAGHVVPTRAAGSTIEAFGKEVSLEGTRKLLATGHDGKRETALPAGDDAAVVALDGASREFPFTVTAGSGRCCP